MDGRARIQPYKMESFVLSFVLGLVALILLCFGTIATKYPCIILLFMKQLLPFHPVPYRLALAVLYAIELFTVYDTSVTELVAFYFVVLSVF